MIGRQVDDRVDDTGEPVDDVSGHVEVRIVVARRHRVDDHQEESGQKTSDVTQADHQDRFRQLDFTCANLPLKQKAASCFGRRFVDFFASHPHFSENKNVAHGNYDERKEKPDGH